MIRYRYRWYKYRYRHRHRHIDIDICVWQTTYTNIWKISLYWYINSKIYKYDHIILYIYSTASKCSNFSKHLYNPPPNLWHFAISTCWGQLYIACPHVNCMEPFLKLFPAWDFQQCGDIWWVNMCEYILKQKYKWFILTTYSNVE